MDIKDTQDIRINSKTFMNSLRQRPGLYIGHETIRDGLIRSHAEAKRPLVGYKVLPLFEFIVLMIYMEVEEESV